MPETLTTLPAPHPAFLGDIGPEGAFDIDGFCAAFKISRAMFYKLCRAGDGPVVMRVGGKPLISYAAAANWRREREAAAA
jgi:hypothetical protein